MLNVNVSSVKCMDDLPTGKFPDYNHNKYGDKPGQMWSADDQCRVLLRDSKAQAFFPASSDLEVGAVSYPLINKNKLMLQFRLNPRL